MTSSIDSHVETCDKCQQVNKKLEKPAATVHPITVDSPWHRIGIDLVGPLPRRMKTSLPALIFFTKWPDADHQAWEPSDHLVGSGQGIRQSGKQAPV